MFYVECHPPSLHSLWLTPHDADGAILGLLFVHISGTVFLFSDTQIFDERQLVDINDLLSSGEIPDLFANDEKDDIVTALRMEVRAACVVDTRENCWAYFVDKVVKEGGRD